MARLELLQTGLPSRSADALRTIASTADHPSEGSHTQPRSRPSVSRSTLGLLVLLVVVAAAAGIAGTLLVAALLPSSSSTTPAVAVSATLSPDPALSWPTQINSDSATPSGGVRYADYLGIAVVSTVTNAGSGHCVYVLPQSTSGALAGGCGAGPFPAQAVITVTTDMPAELTARHPPGTALQFELGDGVMIVRAADRYRAGVPPETAR